ncbi:hypothetical protein AN640_04945 [Candidatus Epulonipiscium fishelsonii]|uniref:Uncharacterized protein n=1 Tax=Candidatus Epulonipiscium fishelsonii TaxID=77094 RepID=A0ACC8XIN9_9FIRM|nr:hypothetical protein AN640_04945 [Epulopiscium sp. SCG-D08WGA-EpuloA1]OON94886.1 MAG: hypothetical protein ATN32_07780 [Epulopiscium sp. AS2M-Bin002]
MKKFLPLLAICSLASVSVLGYGYGQITAEYKVQQLNVNGNVLTQDVIIHNGITYMPIATLSNLLGATATNSYGVFVIKDIYTSPDDSEYIPVTPELLPTDSEPIPVIQDRTGEMITKEKAKSIALEDAGNLGANPYLKISLNTYEELICYKIDFTVWNKDYKYQIDAYSGEIVYYEIE